MIDRFILGWLSNLVYMHIKYAQVFVLCTRIGVDIKTHHYLHFWTIWNKETKHVILWTHMWKSTELITKEQNSKQTQNKQESILQNACFTYKTHN